MTTETLAKVTALFPPHHKGIRTGDLEGAAQRAGVSKADFWAAMTQLEKDGTVRSREVPHKKKAKLHVIEWYIANTLDK